MADKNNTTTTPKEEGNDPNDEVFLFRKTGLACGQLHIISIHRPSVIIDSHMHIQSGNCATLPFIRDSAPLPLNLLNKAVGVSRGGVEGSGFAFSYLVDLFCEWLPTPILHPVRAVNHAITDDPQNPDQPMVHTSPIRQLLRQQKASTLEIGKAFMKERGNILKNFFQTQPEYKDLSHLALSAVVMTMDMEYAHLDGYYGLKIYNAVYTDESATNPSGYWYPKHGFWKKRGDAYEKVPGPAHLFPDRQTKVEFDNYKRAVKGQGIIGAYPKPGGQMEAMRVEAAPVDVPKSETVRYEQWKEQLDFTEQAMLAYPLKMLPMYHYDPRRWQFRQNKLGVFDNVKEGGLYLGFKMYTAQGYRPWDIRRLPVLEDFYAECSRLRIPILNHCTPKGAATVEREMFYDFEHPNDTDKESEEKAEIAKKYKALRGDQLFAGTGSHIPGTTSSTQDFKSQEKEEYFSENFVSPNAWLNVLNSTVKDRPLRDLHLCLAHFGGPTDQGLEWSKQIIEMMVKFPNFYADISSSFASGAFRKHFKKIMQNNQHYETIRNRVLFGTDWYMTLVYTAPFHGMNYWDYCTETKTFLDDFDPSLWPRFTMHNPYRFYRLNEQVPRIAESIIARRQTEEMELLLDKKIYEKEIKEIRKEAAWVRQANDGFGI
jgi:predicted TIM-barrel fold metal-dependent hydrolase